MTCIIGSSRFICADRRITEDGGAVSSMVKLARNPWIIAAAAGDAVCTLAVKRAVREGAERAEDLLETVSKGSYALVLAWDGRLQLISEGALWPCTDRVHAIGSGAEQAVAFMHGAGSFGARTAREAQRFVAKRRADCGGGCDVRSFE